jgi:type I restriction enzyme S subunit
MASSGFPEAVLGPLCSKIGSGATPRGGDKVYLNEGEVALIRSQNVYNDGFNRDGLVYITAEHADQLANVAVQPEDVLLNITGDSVARCCQADPHVLPARVNQHVAIIRPKPDELNPRFLGYFLTSPTMQAQMLAWAHAGATRKALTKGMIESFKVPKPDLPTQQRIAHILGALDDKIELNMRMTRTLEKMAAALFKSWFIDFDPVNAKAEGRDTGLPKDIADLFPTECADSELGAVPKGWTVCLLPDVIHVNPVRRLAKGTAAPYLEMGNMPTHSSRAVDWATRRFNSGTKFKNGDVLVARITPCLENGKTAYVDFLGNDEAVGWGSTEYIVLRSKSPLPLSFAYFLARSERFRAHAITNMSGTSGRQRVPPSCLDSFLIAVPPEPIAGEFGKLVGDFLHNIKKHDDQSRTLARLRDALLPKLLSGEIPINGTTGVVEKETEAEKTEEAVYTIGHSNHSIGQFVGLLKRNEITAVADVRSAPFSRHNPQFNQDALARALKKEGIAYVFLGKELGARPEEPECYDNGAASFERIAARPAFAQGIERVLKGKETYRIALLCAEKEPLDCHRTILVCRHLRQRGVNIKHILADGSIEEHENTERRLVKLAGLEPTLYESPAAASERREAAYTKRAHEIAYRRGMKEREHERAT